VKLVDLMGAGLFGRVFIQFSKPADLRELVVLLFTLAVIVYYWYSYRSETVALTLMRQKNLRTARG
jgi:hypothetical protein